MKHDDKGFSLVEIIIVIAVIGILSGVGISMLGLVGSTQVKDCSKEIVAQLESCRNCAFAYEESSFSLSCESDGIYTTLSVKKKGVVTEEKKKAGQKSISVYYILDNGTEVKLNEGEVLTLSFNRASGSFNLPKLTIGGVVTEADKYCTRIVVKKDSNQRNLTLVPLTGKVKQE